MLDGPLLKYYKTSEQTGAGRNEPPTLVELKGCISLPGCDVLPVGAEASSRPYAFQLTPASRKVFLICARDAASRDAWIEAIRRSATARFDSQHPIPAGEEEAPTEPSPDEMRNVAQDSQEAGVTLGDFELLKVIGRGTYGKVMEHSWMENNPDTLVKIALNPPPRAHSTSSHPPNLPRHPLQPFNRCPTPSTTI